MKFSPITIFHQYRRKHFVHRSYTKITIQRITFIAHDNKYFMICIAAQRPYVQPSNQFTCIVMWITNHPVSYCALIGRRRLCSTSATSKLYCNAVCLHNHGLHYYAIIHENQYSFQKSVCLIVIV